jgi:signal transduction histidine kinase
MAMNRLTVVLVTDEPEFAANITRRWLDEKNVPSFVLAQTNCSSEFDSGNFDLAMVGDIATGALGPVLETLKGTRRPVIHISRLNGHSPREVISIAETQGWPDLLITVANEILQRVRTEGELGRLQEKAAQLELQAALGRYMLDVRHSLNNVLTSILGNSDLILLDAPALPGPQRSQVETIRNMALRLNEVMQRFSSLQKEMQLLEQQREKTQSKKASAAHA